MPLLCFTLSNFPLIEFSHLVWTLDSEASVVFVVVTYLTQILALVFLQVPGFLAGLQALWIREGRSQFFKEPATSKSRHCGDGAFCAGCLTGTSLSHFSACSQQLVVTPRFATDAPYAFKEHKQSSTKANTKERGCQLRAAKRSFKLYLEI